MIHNRYIILSAAFIACSTLPLAAQKITVSPGIPVTAEEIRTAVPAVQNEDSKNNEILIYGYTPPTEVYTLDSTDTLRMKTEQGELRALVKIFRGTKMEKAVFAAGKGDDVKSMIAALAENLLLILPH